MPSLHKLFDIIDNLKKTYNSFTHANDFILAGDFNVKLHPPSIDVFTMQATYIESRKNPWGSKLGILIDIAYSRSI